MSLNDSHMLPERVRSMRQMNDILTVEDALLAEVWKILDVMYQREAMLHEELVNEAWLENKLSARTGADVKATGYADKLQAEIILTVNENIVLDMQDIRDFLNKWLPAHLKYKINDRMIVGIENSTLNGIKLINVCIYLKIPFLPYRSYDGTLRYDGSAHYDAKRNYKLGTSLRLHCGISGLQEKICNMAVESRRSVQYYNGEKCYSGITKYNAMIRKDRNE